MLPIVAIVGKPNTGKSTIFNRLLGKRRAIESDVAGTTRDKLMSKTTIGGEKMYLVDTGGIRMENEDDIEEDMLAQAHIAIDGADVILFVVDGQKPLSGEDFHVAEILRKSGKRTILVANKCDNPDIESRKYNLYELGFGDAVAVAALHKIGLDALSGMIVTVLEEDGKTAPDEKEKDADVVRVSFLGKPNVGKSSLLNAILGKKESIVSDIPGTTRDTVEAYLKHGDKELCIVDTAGVRRRGKVAKGIEKFSVLWSLQAIEDSDVSVLVLDYKEGITSQDMHVASYILEQGNGLIITVNKSDLMDNVQEDCNRFIKHARYKFDFLAWAPLVFVSALENKGTSELLDVIFDCNEERKRRITDTDLSIWLEKTVSDHTPKGTKYGQLNRIDSITQHGIQPPSFTIKTRFPDKVHFSYRRYLENRLREEFGFNGTAIRIRFK